jgi:hypothetical protein
MTWGLRMSVTSGVQEGGRLVGYGGAEQRERCLKIGFGENLVAGSVERRTLND